MGIEQEATARAIIAAIEGEQLDDDRISRVVDDLSTDAKWHVYAWEAPHVGHDAIRAELRRQAPLFSDYQTEIVTLGSVGSTVFMERLDSYTVLDVPMTTHVAAAFEFDGDGKVAVWREYLDRKEIETKMSVDISTISRIGGASASAP